MKIDVKHALVPVKAFGSKVAKKVSKRSPEICVALGVIGMGATVVMACKATLKADEVLDKLAADKAKIEDTKKQVEESKSGIAYDEKDAKRDLAIAYKDAAIGFAKLYWRPALTGAISLGLILASLGIMKKRNATLIAAATAIDERFKEYRKRVTERFGEDVEREIRTGVKKGKQMVQVVDPETGEVSEVEEETTTIEDAILTRPEEYATVIFSSDTSAAFQKGDMIYNESFIDGVVAYWNRILNYRGYVLMSEVLNQLGVPLRNEHLISGWHVDCPDGDFDKDGKREIRCRITRVSKHIGDYNKKSGRIVPLYSGDDYDLLLEFNPDGVIYGLI